MTESEDVLKLVDAERAWVRAKDNHYDKHSRVFPIHECDVKECREAVKTWKKAKR